MTCQEISALARYNYQPVIIVINNKGYTTERGLALDIRKANDIHSWNYEKLIELIGAGRYIGNIKTEKDLDLALCRCFDPASSVTSYKTSLRCSAVNEDRIYYSHTKYNDDDNGYIEEKEEKNNEEEEKKKKDITHHENYEETSHHPPVENRISMLGEEKGEDSVNGSGTIKDMIYCKERGGLIPFSEYMASISETRDERDQDQDQAEKESRKKSKKNRAESTKKLKLKSHYLTLIELQLDPLEMSYGTHRFISLSLKKK